MQQTDETAQQRLSRLQQELAAMHAKMPEHCHGQDGYISDHRATPEHWQKIEDLEEEIASLTAKLPRK